MDGTFYCGSGFVLKEGRTGRNCFRGLKEGGEGKRGRGGYIYLSRLGRGELNEMID